MPTERHPVPRRGFDFAGLSNVLFESADLLEESRESEDLEFRAAALELAIRSLYTASTAIDRFAGSQRQAGAARGAVLTGPWTSGGRGGSAAARTESHEASLPLA